MISQLTLMIRVIIGTQLPMGGIGMMDVPRKFKKMANELTPFTGNQWNENWKWSRNELWKMSVEDLTELFDAICRIEEDS